ncbi:aromatic ring-hydroxylating dioxygenase subunit alpha [Eubacteriaceae bacterium ES3]|nr:aromatic ring-hydroxylating dioxygenase subunit alpha [Eubacteriaceae bacterium ES3]
MIPNQWYAILPSRAVKAEQILAVKRLNLDLALFRNVGGELGCVVDQCSHRGAALSKGKVKGDCIQCPFHGLEFDHKGRCTCVPASGKASTEDLSRFNVIEYEVREKNDIIYLWFGEPDKMTDTLPFFGTDINDAYSFSEMEDHWNTHYSRSIENQLDVIHLPFVHHNTIGRGNKTLVNGPKVEFVPGGLVTSANNEVDTGQSPKPAEECEIKSTYLKFMFPNLWMNHISDTMKVIIYFAPVDDENTILYIRFYCQVSGFRPLNSLIAWSGKYGNRIIERQDKRVVTTQKPKASSFISKENLLPGDGPVIQYRRIRDELKRSM